MIGTYQAPLSPLRVHSPLPGVTDGANTPLNHPSPASTTAELGHPDLSVEHYGPHDDDEKDPPPAPPSTPSVTSYCHPNGRLANGMACWACRVYESMLAPASPDIEVPITKHPSNLLRS